MIRRFFARRGGSPGAAKAAARRARRRRPALEALEGRALLSFLGSIQRVSLNPEATDNTDSDNASSADGTSVAVWVNAFSAADHDIWAQRFDVAGHAAGGPIPVDFSTANSFHPRVARDSQGRFVVTWENRNPDGTSGVWMRYFDASGAPLTSRVPVSEAGLEDVRPDVAASNGSFVITWEQFGAGSGNRDILAERFVISGGVPQGPGRPIVLLIPSGHEGDVADDLLQLRQGNPRLPALLEFTRCHIISLLTTIIRTTLLPSRPAGQPFSLRP